jgi:hypothetical protein
VRGYETEACGVDTDLIDLSTNTGLTPAQCRTCRSACYERTDFSQGGGGSDGTGESGGSAGAGGGFGGIPRCIVDAEGRIALPAE